MGKPKTIHEAKSNLYKETERYYRAVGSLNAMLHIFGDELAKQEDYKGLGGIEAIHFYLIKKFHWLPRDVRAISLEDLRFVLTEELKDWTVPEGTFS